MKVFAEEEGLDCPSPKSALLAVHKLSLIKSIDDWLPLLHARNQTVHTYNEKTAEKVYEAVRVFGGLAASLVRELERKIKNS